MSTPEDLVELLRRGADFIDSSTVIRRPISADGKPSTDAANASAPSAPGGASGSAPGEGAGQGHPPIPESESLGFAHVDHDRPRRCGMPEVIFGQSKTPEQIVAVAEAILAKGQPALATRLTDEGLHALARRFPEGEYIQLARTALIGTPPPPVGRRILVVSAGTSDLPVAGEALATLKALGRHFGLIQDVGVAGMHRLMAYRDEFIDAGALIVVAGMEGALPSVVGGLVPCPVIAVPTSVGYGASFGGVAALLGMLNSCSGGVTVVNIDNGFGAACAAARIVRPRPPVPEAGSPAVPSADGMGTDRATP